MRGSDRLPNVATRSAAVPRATETIAVRLRLTTSVAARRTSAARRTARRPFRRVAIAIPSERMAASAIVIVRYPTLPASAPVRFRVPKVSSRNG